MSQIDYYFATVSPFTYIAGTRMEAIAARHGARVAYKPLDILGLFARTGGTPPKDRHESRRAYRLQELRRQAAKAGLPINLAPAHWPTNPAPSSYAIIAASKTQAGADPARMGALVHAMTRACWAEERDIAQDEVIREVLEGQGFDPALTDEGMLAGAEDYARNLEDAVARGVFGAPFYLVGEEGFWGQDRLDDLGLHLAGESVGCVGTTHPVGDLHGHAGRRRRSRRRRHCVQRTSVRSFAWVGAFSQSPSIRASATPVLASWKM